MMYEAAQQMFGSGQVGCDADRYLACISHTNICKNIYNLFIS